jgi:hypothetical protein
MPTAWQAVAAPIASWMAQLPPLQAGGAAKAGAANSAMQNTITNGRINLGNMVSSLIGDGE